ncbi:hypothetical protein GCM10010954_16810 [Halobacillus andaensis]|uniref:Uncharacterized protein n=1 Tax=Halobacillus andaensis TaxID=1176239 RepID=A0A917B3Z7_HALAA|nr:hypothetical protein [Halobacillus andaensis]MBP2004818.1 glucose dehydrogenase [Halobacillus andaensis]GGF18659.1 hypothetical protein GCM10010954_16810 [Halobacillus andaensis]
MEILILVFLLSPLIYVMLRKKALAWIHFVLTGTAFTLWVSITTGWVSRDAGNGALLAVLVAGMAMTVTGASLLFLRKRGTTFMLALVFLMTASGLFLFFDLNQGDLSSFIGVLIYYFIPVFVALLALMGIIQYERRHAVS